MNKTNKKNDRNKQIIPIAAIALSAVVLLTGVVSIATSGTKAKYKTVVKASDVTVTVDANLASSLLVLEHPATRNSDGSYSVNKTAEPVTENRYILMPGVSNEKDPYVKITGKTKIPAYLYVEAVDSTGLVTAGETPEFQYSLTSNWSRLEGVSVHTGGTVYYYTGELPIGDSTIPILAGDTVTITVTGQFGKGADYSETLTFYAYLAQKVDNKRAAEIFEDAGFQPQP